MARQAGETSDAGAEQAVAPPRRRPKRRFPPGVEREAERLFRAGMTGEEAWSRVQKDFAWRGLPLPNPFPTVRTFERLRDDMEEFGLLEMLSRRWRPLEAPPDMARLVLPVLREVTLTYDGAPVFFTEEEADYCYRIRTLAPDLGPWRVYLVAIDYLALEQAGEPTTDYATLLAFQPWPWRHEDAQTFADAVADGVIPRSVEEIRELLFWDLETRGDWPPAAEPPRTEMKLDLIVTLDAGEPDERMYMLSTARPYTRVPAVGESVSLTPDAGAPIAPIDEVLWPDDGIPTLGFDLKVSPSLTEAWLLSVGYERIDDLPAEGRK